MKVPYSWLKEYVDTDLPAEALEEKLFGCGFEVEELIDLGKEISRVVVGEVTSCEKVEGTQFELNLSGLAPGVYMLRFVEADAILNTIKVVKE